jgi:hypothetical protein
MRASHTTDRSIRATNGVRTCLAALLLGGGILVAGCGGNAEEKVPQESSAAASSRATGDHHHDDPASEQTAHTHSTRLEFSSQPAEIPVGKPFTMTLKIVDIKSGEPVKDFATVHEKLLHLILVSSDLSWFNHIHPEYQGNGVFTVVTTMPRAGGYKLYADYTPKDAEHEVAEHLFATAGAATTPSTPVTAADTMNGAWMLKQVTSIPEGEPEFKGGDAYQVALMPMPSKLVAGEDAMLHFQVRDKDGKPLDAIESYLGAMGHAVILSSDAKIYLHTHPMDGDMDHGAMDHGAMNHGGTKQGDSGAPATGEPKPGLYKVWGQFQHKGRIVTAPFVVSVAPAA